MSQSGGPATSAYPPGATPQHVSSGNQANAAAVAALPVAAGQTNYLTGFEASAAGSTAGAVVNITITGLAHTLNYSFTFPASATQAAQTVAVEFNPPVPASGPGVAITATLPASGAGGTNAVMNVHGYSL